MMLGSPTIGFSKVSVLYLHFPAETSATFALDLSSIFIEILELSEIFFIGWIYSYRRKEGPEGSGRKNFKIETQHISDPLNQYFHLVVLCKPY
jgi:hypothetical protein